MKANRARETETGNFISGKNLIHFEVSFVRIPSLEFCSLFRKICRLSQEINGLNVERQTNHLCSYSFFLSWEVRTNLNVWLFFVGRKTKTSLLLTYMSVYCLSASNFLFFKITPVFSILYLFKTCPGVIMIRQTINCKPSWSGHRVTTQRKWTENLVPKLRKFHCYLVCSAEGVSGGG